MRLSLLLRLISGDMGLGGQFLGLPEPECLFGRLGRIATAESCKSLCPDLGIFQDSDRLFATVQCCGKIVLAHESHLISTEGPPPLRQDLQSTRPFPLQTVRSVRTELTAALTFEAPPLTASPGTFLRSVATTHFETEVRLFSTVRNSDEASVDVTDPHSSSTNTLDANRWSGHF